MDLSQLDAIKWPERREGLCLTHNEYLSNYSDVTSAIRLLKLQHGVFAAKGELDRCVASSSIWKLSWVRPDHVPMIAVGSTLNACLRASGIDGCGLDAITWPKHMGGLSLTLDEHLSVRIPEFVDIDVDPDIRVPSVAECVRSSRYDALWFSGDAEIIAAIDSGHCWKLQWFPEDATSFYVACAATLSKLMKAVVPDAVPIAVLS